MPLFLLYWNFLLFLARCKKRRLVFHSIIFMIWYLVTVQHLNFSLLNHPHSIIQVTGRKASHTSRPSVTSKASTDQPSVVTTETKKSTMTVSIQCDPNLLQDTTAPPQEEGANQKNNQQEFADLWTNPSKLNVYYSNCLSNFNINCYINYYMYTCKFNYYPSAFKMVITDSKSFLN